MISFETIKDGLYNWAIANTSQVSPSGSYKTTAVFITASVNNFAYTVTINGTAFVYTSGTGQTVAAIAAGLVAVVNAGTVPVLAIFEIDGRFYLNSENGVAFTLTASANIKVPVFAVYFGEQNNPQANNFITMKITGLTRTGIDYQGRPATTGANSVTGNRDFMVYIYAQGTNALLEMENLRSSLYLDATLEGFRVSDFCFVDETAIQNLSVLEETTFQESVSFDVQFRMAQIQTANVGKIEHLEAQGKYYKDNVLKLTENITI